MITYNNIIEAFSDFATNHFFIKSFSHGNVEEMDLDKSTSFPLMHVVYTGSDYDDSQKNYSFEIFIVDLPDDKDGDKVTFQREVISDSEQCAEDLISDLYSGFNIFSEDFHYDRESASVTPVEEEGSNVIAGVVMDVSISVPFQNDSCNLPLTGVTPTSATCDDATIDATDGDDVVTTLTTVASGATYTFAKIDIIQQDDTTIDYGRIDKDIKVTNADITSVTETATQLQIAVDVPTQSGIVYNQIYPNQIESYQNYDTGYNVQQGNYKRTYPVYPVSYGVPYYLADQSAVRVTPATGTLSTDSVWPTVLVDNNSFGNKLVYTDTLGNPSDSAGDELYSHVDWINHSFTGAEDGIVIDHVRNLTIDINYITDGTKFSLSSTAADGQAWRDWLAYVGTLGTHHGLTGWRVPSLEEANAGAHGAKVRREPWALKFFNAERSDNRCGMLTGDTVDDDTTDFWVLYDSGNQVYMQELEKAVSSGFANRITNIFIVRNHHA